MRIKIHSSEINRMMKTVSQCIEQKGLTGLSNIEIIYDNNLLTIRGTNGQVSAIMSTPMLGGDGETFCVDGGMFGKVCAMCNGEIEISTTEKDCTIKGAGRTRLPVVSASIPAQERIVGSTVTVAADDFIRCYKGVAHAVADEQQSRIQLTGIYTIAYGTQLRMVTLDGFQMSTEAVPCGGDEAKMLIPGSFMKLVANGAFSGETIRFRTDGKRVEASTDGMVLTCGMLTGEFPDYLKILPTSFATDCLIKVDELRNALKGGSIVNSKQNLVKLEIGADTVRINNNSEEADYEAEIGCGTHGNGLKIAFNQKYLTNAINAIDTEDAVMRFNSSVTPCIIQPKDGDGVRLVLPVRVAG